MSSEIIDKPNTIGISSATSWSKGDAIRVYALGTDYLFCWDEVPERTKNLIEFLKNRKYIEWPHQEIPSIVVNKTDDGKTITVEIKDTYYKSLITFLLELDNYKTKVILKINGEPTDEFIARTEKEELNIYGTDNLLKEYCWDNDHWHDGKFTDKKFSSNSAPSAISWSNGDAIRVYALGTDNLLKEYCWDNDHWYEGLLSDLRIPIHF